MDGEVVQRAAMRAMAMGRFEDAEKELLEALQKDSKDPDTLHNLAVCALHLGKPSTRFFNQLKTLTPNPYGGENGRSWRKFLIRRASKWRARNEDVRWGEVSPLNILATVINCFVNDSRRVYIYF